MTTMSSCGIAAYRLFVVVTLPRSGSNHLMSLLRSHPEIGSARELLRAGRPRHVLRRTIDRVPGSRRVAGNLAVGAVRRHLAEYVEPVRGFKLMLRQHPAALRALVADGDVAVVHLTRENVLASYSSSLIAKATGQGAARVGDRIRRTTVPFDSRDFERYRLRVLRANAHLDDLCRRSGREPLHLEYRRLADPVVLEVLLTHLGVRTAPLTSRTAKRNTSDIAMRFVDPDAVRAHLDVLGRPEWASEDA
jgi:LPS sulfotransferase NodH